MRRFNQPYLIQSNNASLSIRFRMDPATGADQVIEGAFAYYNGEFLVSFQSTILGILETVPSEFMRFYVLLFVVFFINEEQSSKVSGDLGLYATRTTMRQSALPTAALLILSIRPSSGRLSVRSTVLLLSVPRKENPSRLP